MPPPVRAGDRVGVAALSGPVDGERLAAGVAELRRLGFVPVVADNCAECDPSGLFAGDDERRLAAFHQLVADPSLAAVFFARGGHGVLRLLPRLDWELLAARPRAYVGYSDLTPFLLAVTRRLGLVAFHGPMVGADLARGLTAEEASSLASALAGEVPAALAVSVAEVDRDRSPAGGRLVGGCLSLLTALLGTPFFPDLAGALLFLEDVGEPLYRVDRMLTQLRLAGQLDALHGLIFGHLDDGSAEATAAPLLEPLLASLAGSPWPVAWGLEAGHRAPNRTLPLGLAARLEPAAGRLVLGAG